MATGTQTYSKSVTGYDRNGGPMQVTYNVSETWDNVQNISTCQITSIVFSYYTAANNAYPRTTKGTGGTDGHTAAWGGYSSFGVVGGTFVNISESDTSWTIPFGGTQAAYLMRNGSVYSSSPFTVQHDSSGNASITIASYWSWGTVSSADTFPRDTRGGINGGFNNYDQSVVINLTSTAPGNSSITIPSTEYSLGSVIPYTITSSVSTYRHDVSYSLDNVNWSTIAGNQTSGTHNWDTSDVPLTVSKTVYLRCVTKSGSTQIGSASVITLTLMVSGSPTISSIVITPINTNSTIRGWANNTLYVQNYSQAEVRVNYSLPSGASVSSCRITCNDEVLANSSTGSAQSVAVTNVLTQSGENVISATVTDSRGKSATLTKTFNVLPYTPPYTSARDAIRYSTNVNVEDRDNGTNISAKATLSYSSVSGYNTGGIAVRYKAAGGTYGSSVSLVSGSANHVKINGSAVLDTGTSYVVQFLAYDSLHTLNVDPTTAEVTIATKSVVISCHDGGDGIAFGGYAEGGYKVQVADGWTFEVPGTEDVWCVSEGQTLKAIIDAGGGEAGDYNNLSNRPSINGVLLSGNKTSEELHITGGGTTNYNDLSNRPQINGHTLTGNQTAEDLGIEGKAELYKVTYNSTTIAQVMSAVADGKLPYLERNGSYYYCVLATSTECDFVRYRNIGLLEMFYITSASGWGYSSSSIPTDTTREAVANKVTSISSASTDTEYPSAKCVYDMIGDIATALEALL